MKDRPLGVPRPVALSQPGPVVSDESVPNVKTSQRVEVELWKSALMNPKRETFSSGCAKNCALSNVGAVGGLRINPVTFAKVLAGFTFTSVMALDESW